MTVLSLARRSLWNRRGTAALVVCSVALSVALLLGVERLRTEARKKGLDPNVWFRNVELIAARRIGRETVQYVSNVYKYYVAYRLIVDRLDLMDKVKVQSGK